MNTVDFLPTHEIKPGAGYWDATKYPIGGKFCRVGREQSLPVVLLQESQLIGKYGWQAKFQTSDNRIIFTQLAVCVEL